MGLSRAAVAAAVLVMGCRDRDAERVATATIRYHELVRAGESPYAPSFDEVLAELAAVPDASSSASEARALASRIHAARQHVRTPLALGSSARRPAVLQAQLAACARLAQLAGMDGGATARALEGLEACRRSAERMELRYAHGGEHGHEEHGAPDGGDDSP